MHPLIGAPRRPDRARRLRPMPTKWRLAGAAAAVVAALVVAWPRVARVGARAALRARIIIKNRGLIHIASQ